jgi:hypothetical protein
MQPYADAIASIESGGRYGLLGPVTRTGDRAYGKYQVMGANLPAWTKAALGQSLTPEQFLASPQAQDAVFRHQFGQYVAKHGPEGAARAWFAGEGGMRDGNRKDQLGTSVDSYGRKFMAALGGSQAPAGGLLDRPASSPGLLGNNAPQAPAGLLGNPMAQMGMGMMAPQQAPMAPPAMPPPMPRRQVDLSALQALANMPRFAGAFS